ncbi:MAG: triose-phosphate isomerase [Candidatus Paceibacterota bacterium]
MKKIVIANWKCFPETKQEAQTILKQLNPSCKGLKNTSVTVCLPFPFLQLACNFKQPSISFGAQNCFWLPFGAYTGEVSASQLATTGVQYVILGHSERRQHFNEPNDIINKKIKLCLENKMKAVLCVGESFEDRQLKRENAIIRGQILQGLKDFGPKEMVNLCIAYEPVWAIGSGKPCSSEDAKNMATYIKGLMYEVFGAKEFPVIYGGSVNSGNAKDYITNGNMDGLLVGRASLDWQEFVNIILSIEKNKA